MVTYNRKCFSRWCRSLRDLSIFSFGSNENGELGVRAEVVASDIPLEVEFDWGSLVSRGGVGEVELEKG